jgi:predicted transcriptional regulator
MIEQINEKLHRGRSAIVRRAIEHLYLDLKERGLLDDSAGEGNRGRRKGRGAS